MTADDTQYQLLQSQREGIAELLSYSVEQAIALFKSLRAPDYRKMDGEFKGHIPFYIREEWEAFVEDSGMGRWLGKGFRVGPLTGAAGQGYNMYKKERKIIRRLKFAWSIQPSEIDGAPSVFLKYSTFSNWAGANDLIDEIRQAAPSLFLGLYHTREPVQYFTPRSGGTRSAMEFFILSGPVGPAREANRD
jgi:hypothetical protein